LDGLLRNGEDPSTFAAELIRLAEARDRFSAPALFAWQELADTIALAITEEASRLSLAAMSDSVAARLATVQDLEALRADAPALSAAARTRRNGRGGGAGPVWVPYGDEPWLVGLPRNAGEEDLLLPVIRPSLLLNAAEGYELELAEAARVARPLHGGGEEGEPLGAFLNDLRVSFPADFPPPPGEGTIEGWFYRLLLPLILILTGITAYLAWRDVRRESEAVRLRSQFVSSVTHELKTPLTSIRMFAETLRLGRQSSPEARQEYLDTVIHETQRLGRLINNVLDFARIDRGEMTYHLSLTDLGSVVQEAAQAVAYPLAQGGYTLVTDIAEGLPLIQADGDALTQALLNLLSNAIKFSDEGSQIELHVFSKDRAMHLQVRDEGRGIDAHELESIFTDFYRTAEVEEEGIPGTGLGLPLVAHVAEAHGGEVDVESAPGSGSTFTVRIPLATNSAQARHEETGHDPAAADVEEGLET
jgi:signal transduction histidine kinase